MFAGTKSLRGNQAAQVWTDGDGFCLFFPMQSKSQAPDTIWKNKAEAEIREVKRMIKTHMYKTQCPKRFWCFCGEWVAAIRRFIAHNMPILEGTNPYERIYARSADISEYVQFDWYQFVWYIEPVELATGIKSRRGIGRWLGVSTSAGSKLCYRILNSKGNVINRSSVIPVKQEEKTKDDVIARIKEHDDMIKIKFGDQILDPEFNNNVAAINHFEYQLFDDDDADDLLPVDPELTVPDDDDHPDPDVFDNYLTANILLDRQGDAMRGTVVARAKDTAGKLTGKAHPNPLLDTREYIVEYSDGSLDVLTANNIAESLYSRVDSEGHEQMLMQEIIDHKFDGNLLSKDDMIRGLEDYVVRQRVANYWLIGEMGHRHGYHCPT
jgi:hypothetical protein